MIGVTLRSSEPGARMADAPKTGEDTPAARDYREMRKTPGDADAL